MRIVAQNFEARRKQPNMPRRLPIPIFAKLRGLNPSPKISPPSVFYRRAHRISRYSTFDGVTSYLKVYDSSPLISREHIFWVLNKKNRTFYYELELAVKKNMGQLLRGVVRLESHQV